MKKLNLDLRIGGTDFLVPYWQHVMRIDGNNHIPAITPAWRTGYPKQDDDFSLKQAILGLHSSIENAEVAGYQVVIGNGATQILMAALSATAALNDVEAVWAKPPYWFRFPVMSNLAGLKFVHRSDPVQKGLIEIVTSPSNPTNEVYDALPRDPGLKIHDLCYNWPQYTHVIKQNKDIMIFSLAKAIGYGSSRIGWALVKDPTVAREMELYIEHTTGGVSAEAQERARLAMILQHDLQLEYFQNQGALRPVFEEAKLLLENRWANLRAINNPNLKILNNSGMFLWLRYGEDKLDRSAMDEFHAETGVLGVAGERCGGGANKIRLSVSGSNAEFQGLLEALRFAK